MVFACEYGRLQKRSWQRLHGFSLRPLRSAQPHPSKCWAIAAKAPFQPSPSRPFHRWRAPPRRGSVRTPRMKVPGAAWRGATSSRLTSAFCRTALSAERRGVGVGQQRAVRPRGHLSIGRSWLTWAEYLRFHDRQWTTGRCPTAILRGRTQIFQRACRLRRPNGNPKLSTFQTLVMRPGRRLRSPRSHTHMNNAIRPAPERAAADASCLLHLRAPRAKEPSRVPQPSADDLRRLKWQRAPSARSNVRVLPRRMRSVASWRRRTTTRC